MSAPQGPRIGSLCSGYEGLGAAIQEVLGGDLAFVADPDPGASRILAHHHPDVPNLGDITQVDWEEVLALGLAVEILAAGFPCQDLSVAGRGAGIADGTRSGLWLHIVHAIRTLRPDLVVIENVPGIRTRPAHSDMEPCPWCVGNQCTEPVLRALGAVLGGLADLGFDAEWVSVPASAVGAPHRRERVFVLAWPADAHPQNLRYERPGPARHGRPGPAHSGHAAADASCPTCGHPESHHDDGGYCAGCGTCTDPELGRPDGGHGATAPTHPEGLRRGEGGAEPARVERRPDAALGGCAAPTHPDGGAVLTVPHSEPQSPETHHLHHRVDAPGRFLGWGPYTDAIHRWEYVLGRPAPLPTEPGRNGQPRLNPRFVEWMQGLPEGWVTSPEIGLKRNEQLKALGNGVVPQQGAHALRLLLDRAFPAAVTA